MIRRTFVLLLLLVAAPATARKFTIETTPGAATWRDRVVVTVRGGGTLTTCGAAAVTLSEPRFEFFAGGPYRIVLDLTEECDFLTPPLPETFVVTAELEPLPPRRYTLQVRDLIHGGEVSEAPLDVHELSPLQIELPTARSDAPAKVVGRSWGDCFGFGYPPRIAGRVIELDFFKGCPFEPFGFEVSEFEEELGVLAPGSYEVRVFDHSSWAPSVPELPTVVRGTLLVVSADGCVPGTTTLCLHDGRFRIEVAWRDFAGRHGAGGALPLAASDDSGLFWFFDAENVELTARVLDGCGVGGHWWVFLAGGSTVEYTVTVTDTRTGATRTYRKELHALPRLIADTSAFACP